MEYISQVKNDFFKDAADLQHFAGSRVKVNGMVHKIREMSGFAFIILRTKQEQIQCVYSGDLAYLRQNKLVEECAVIIEGDVVLDARVTNGAEVHITSIEVVARPADSLPVVVNKKKLDVALDTNLTYRPVALRESDRKGNF